MLAITIPPGFGCRNDSRQQPPPTDSEELTFWLIHQGQRTEEKITKVESTLQGILKGTGFKRLNLVALDWSHAFHCIALAAEGNVCEAVTKTEAKRGRRAALPHLIHYGTTWTTALEAVGALRSLDALVSVNSGPAEGTAIIKTPNAKPLKLTFHRAALNSCFVSTPGTQGRHLVGLPLFLDLRLIPYRRDVLKTALGMLAGGHSKFLREEDLQQGRWTNEDFRDLLTAIKKLIGTGQLEKTSLCGQTGRLTHPVWLPYQRNNNLIHTAFSFVATAALASAAPTEGIGFDTLTVDGASGWSDYFSLIIDGHAPWPSASQKPPNSLETTLWGDVEKDGFYAGRTALLIGGGSWTLAGMCDPDVLRNLPDGWTSSAACTKSVKEVIGPCATDECCKTDECRRAVCLADRTKKIGYALFPARPNKLTNNNMPHAPALHFLGGGNIGISAAVPDEQLSRVVLALSRIFVGTTYSGLADELKWLPSDLHRTQALLPHSILPVVFAGLKSTSSYPNDRRFGGRVEPILIDFARRVLLRIASARPDTLSRNALGTILAAELRFAKRSVDYAIDPK